MYACSKCERVKSQSLTRALFSIIARKLDGVVVYVTCHNCRP